MNNRPLYRSGPSLIYIVHFNTRNYSVISLRCLPCVMINHGSAYNYGKQENAKLSGRGDEP